jgi:hypothetical protein
MTDSEVLTSAAQIVRTRLTAPTRRGRFMIRVVARCLDRFAPMIDDSR